MRADRLLRLLLLLQQHPKLSAAAVAERLEVSRRTVLRDMEALSTAGVPVYTERGRGGGCVLLPGYRADLSGLTAREAQALFAWTGQAALAELGLDGALRSALAKLSATMPEVTRAQSAALSDVVVVDRRPWFATAGGTDALPALRQAVLAGHRVRVRYASNTSGTGARTLDPWGLVDHSGRWYLVAAHRGTARLYRVSRVERVDVLDTPCQRPDGLDVRAEWERLRTGFEAKRGAVPGVTVTVRVDPDQLSWVRRICASRLGGGARPEQLPPLDGDDWPRLRLAFDIRKQALGMLLGFGTTVQVLEPAEFRDELARTAAEVAALY
ncbi:putative DNA-binding transcriptional regulator YafY [Herbihabitans rhizosphaerae]|uniref:Putative DNA-binding transcriptional regulator YafY n=1 Tax=Herbihabitans rhizosphaerae TaxID=1872711 RepID=A0A4Q7L3M6_9PSEU|nr:YafY family protein [Herbihabitans rhizosphaerae]RZS43756.1 putative DNA-binding transcriptional regulator YafY [Herbihabitans rhizosphaerae]